MVAASRRTSHSKFDFSAATRLTLAAVFMTVAGAGTASASISESFLQVPGIAGGWKGESYKNWVKIESQYWDKKPETTRGGGRRSKLFFSAPPAPRQGPGAMVVSVDKHSPVLRQLMDSCAKKTKFAEVSYAESSIRARSLAEIGPLPADMPAFYEYKLKDATFSDCPVVADAPEQALVMSFNGIEWLNYKDEGPGKEITLPRASLKPLKTSGETKSFVVTWMAVAHDVSADQCAKMSDKPSEADYYALMSKDEAAKERAEIAAAGKGISFENGQYGKRGPHRMNVCAVPGVVKASSPMVAPQKAVARGIDVDGSNGAGAAPAGTCKHANYASEDGRAGIDNQLYRVMGCMQGYLGHKGFLMQYSNEQRKNGLISVLVQVSGIDNEQNDDSIDVTILYSKDHMAKNASGSAVLADYTFRVTDAPEYAHYFTQLHGKIVNGVIMTDPVEALQFNLAIDPELTLYHGSLRLEIQADGSIKGVAGGYQDWRRMMILNSNSNSENLYGFQCPALYSALKHSADGLKDPVTGECNGISAAYDIEGVPAFIPPGQYKALVADADSRTQKAR